jgi:MarR family 2-MHQ and catechol resistance regulon transcriptional repressor
MPTHYHGAAAETRALDTFIKLVRAAASVEGRTSAAFASEGLTTGQFGVLEALLHLGPLHQCDLARKHLLSGGNVTMIVDNLEKRSLVRRERSVKDRRYIQVHLTPRGRKMIQRIFPGHAHAVTEQMAVLSPAEQEELGRLCRKLGIGANAETGAPR